MTPKSSISKSSVHETNIFKNLPVSFLYVHQKAFPGKPCEMSLFKTAVEKLSATLNLIRSPVEYGNFRFALRFFKLYQFEVNVIDIKVFINIFYNKNGSVSVVCNILMVIYIIRIAKRELIRYRSNVSSLIAC